MANEFKIKNGLIVGTPPSQPIQSIQDTSVSITFDASSILVTGKAIYDYVGSISGVSTLAGLSDVSIVDISDYNILRYDASSSKWINIAPTEASLYFWSLDIPLLRESSIGYGLSWNGGLLDVSVTEGGGGVDRGVSNGLQILGDGSIGLGGVLTEGTTSVNLNGTVFYILDPTTGTSIQLGGIPGSEYASLGAFNSTFTGSQINLNSTQLLLEHADTVESQGSRIYLVNNQIRFEDIASNIWVIADASGLRYNTDLSSTWGPQSLVDKNYVDLSIGTVWTKFGDIDTSLSNLDSSITDLWVKLGYVDTSLSDLDSSILDIWTQLNTIDVPGATNGLSKFDGSIGLGGILTQQTDVTLNSNKFSLLSGVGEGLIIETNGDITLANSQAGITVIGDTVTIDAPGNDRLIISKSIGTAFRSSTGHGGIKYETDYSNYYTERSLIDQGFLDSSLNIIWTKFGYVDTSLSSLDSSILDIWTKFGYVDTSLNEIWTKFGDVDTSLSAIDSSITEIYSMILDSSITKIGDQNTDGSWRFVIDSSGNLSVQKRISSTWVEKGNFN